MSIPNQHSERILALLDEICLDSLETTLEKIVAHREWSEKQQVSSLFLRLHDELQSLFEQVQSLEIACDHHKMFWQKAEERERGLKEQLEAAHTALRWIERFAYGNHQRHTGFTHIQRRAMTALNDQRFADAYPASEPEKVWEKGRYVCPECRYSDGHAPECQWATPSTAQRAES